MCHARDQLVRCDALRGLNVRFAEVANLVGPADADETHSFAQIVEAARRLGIEAIPLKVGPRELANLPTPAIVQVNKPKDDQAIPHLQVFLGSDARGVRLLDPPYPAHVIPLGALPSDLDRAHPCFSS